MLPFEPAATPSEPRDAATVILLREGATGPEVFLVQRSSRSSFMANAYVFPGGKLDDADCLPAVLNRCEGHDAHRAAVLWGSDLPIERTVGLYVAAARETFEEAGLLFAHTPLDADLARARRRLQANGSFAEILGELGATLRLDRLHPYARWITPAIEPRRFDTRFFVAAAPLDQIALHDEHETSDATWMRPADAVSRDEAGEFRLAPPTRRNLELLAAHPSVTSILEDADSRPPPTVEPVFREIDGQWALLLPGDPEHPVRTRALPGPVRYVLRDGRWWNA